MKGERMKDKSKKSILEMAQEYNEAEDAQKTRLNEIFFALRELSGYRKVTFSNGELWSNCWTFDDLRSQKLVLDRMTQKIEKLEMP